MCFWLGTEAAFTKECWLVSGRYHFSCLFNLQKILISKHFSLHRTYLFLISAFCWHNFLFLPAGSVYEMIHQVVSESPSSPSSTGGVPGEPWATAHSLPPCGRGRRKPGLGQGCSGRWPPSTAGTASSPSGLSRARLRPYCTCCCSLEQGWTPKGKKMFQTYSRPPDAEINLNTSIQSSLQQENILNPGESPNAGSVS